MLISELGCMFPSFRIRTASFRNFQTGAWCSTASMSVSKTEGPGSIPGAPASQLAVLLSPAGEIGVLPGGSFRRRRRCFSDLLRRFENSLMGYEASSRRSPFLREVKRSARRPSSSSFACSCPFTYRLWTRFSGG